MGGTGATIVKSALATALLLRILKEAMAFTVAELVSVKALL
jgi:hypothetical protein